MPDLRFACTLCGRCCHGHNLPLTIDEAVAWLKNDGAVALFCEAAPWASEPPQADAQAAHIRRRSFHAASGATSIRVIVTLVAVIKGPCRNLGPDNKCRIYETRPLVCRIYPAEINPFITLDPDGKECPPEAWQSGTRLIAGGRTVDPEVGRLIEASRRADEIDAPRKRVLCRLLGIDVAGLKGAGAAIYAPAPGILLASLHEARKQPAEEDAVASRWWIHTPSPSSAEILRRQGVMAISSEPPDKAYLFATLASSSKARPAI